MKKFFYSIFACFLIVGLGFSQEPEPVVPDTTPNEIPNEAPNDIPKAAPEPLPPPKYTASLIIILTDTSDQKTAMFKQDVDKFEDFNECIKETEAKVIGLRIHYLLIRTSFRDVQFFGRCHILNNTIQETLSLLNLPKFENRHVVPQPR